MIKPDMLYICYRPNIRAVLNVLHDDDSIAAAILQAWSAEGDDTPVQIEIRSMAKRSLNDGDSYAGYLAVDFYVVALGLTNYVYPGMTDADIIRRILRDCLLQDVNIRNQVLAAYIRGGEHSYAALRRATGQAINDIPIDLAYAHIIWKASVGSLWTRPSMLS